MVCRVQGAALAALALVSLPFASGVAHADGARRFCYTVSTVESGQTTYFETKQQRCDVVWMADKVTIDEPLMSNGGDVVIFAESVEINAPIDTRPYFVTNQVFYDPAKSNTWVEPWSYYGGDLIPSHSALFYWRESYDHQKKLLDFAESKGHWDDFKDAWLASKYSAPQLPAARTPKFGVGGKVWNIKNGQDAPKPGSEARLSGSILIVADRIAFCDLCREPFSPVPLAPGGDGAADDGDVRRRKFLITTGVKGGLGSPGTQMGCQKYSLCGGKDWENIGGFNSDGGDGGDIHVIQLGMADGSGDLVERLSEADAGMPPFAARLRARSMNAMNASKARDRNSFERVPIRFASASKAGEIRVERSASLEVALAALQSRLGSWSFTRKYDAKPLVDQIRLHPDTQEVVLPIDMLVRRLLDVRRTQYLAMLDRLPRQTEHGAQDLLQASTPLVRNLSCDTDLRLALQASIGHEVAALCRRDRIPFSILDSDPTTVTGASYDGLALRNRIQAISDAVNRLSLDVKEGVQLLDDANVRADSQALEARAQALAGQIETLRAAASQSDDPFASALGALASEALPGLADGIRLLHAARTQSDPTKADGDYKKASDKFAGTLGILAKRMGGLLSRSDSDTTAQEQQLADELSEVLRELAQLQEDAQMRRETRLQVLGASAQSLMADRRRLHADYRTALDSFEPLVRYALLRAATRSSGTHPFLNQRTAELRLFLASMGTDSLPPTFFGSFLGCAASETQALYADQPGERSAPDCVRVVNRSGQALSIEARHSALGTVSLFVLEPGRQKELSLRTLNFARDANGQTLLTIRRADSSSVRASNTLDVAPAILERH